jgi:hypothetical protein
VAEKLMRSKIKNQGEALKKPKEEGVKISEGAEEGTMEEEEGNGIKGHSEAMKGQLTRKK